MIRARTIYNNCDDFQVYFFEVYFFPGVFFPGVFRTNGSATVTRTASVAMMKATASAMHRGALKRYYGGDDGDHLKTSSNISR